MFKSLYISLFCILLCLSSSAQKTGSVLYKDTIVGTNARTNIPIHANKYQFNGYITRFYNDTSTGYLMVQLNDLSNNEKRIKQSGKALVYDKVNKKVNWERKAFEGVYEFFQTGEYLFCITNDKTVFLDPVTGKVRYELPRDIYYIDPLKKTGLGYSPSEGLRADSLKGVDMRIGKKTWSRFIDRRYGFSVAGHLDDSSVLVEASGLHKVNLYTGTGWSYNSRGGKKSYAGLIGAVTANVLMAALTGYAPTMYNYPGTNLITSSSNILCDSARHFYYATKDDLACLDSAGNIIWQIDLPRGTSNSRIVIKGDNLYFFNLGTSTFNNNANVQNGKPFIAVFDKKDGNKKFLILPPADYIKDIALADDRITLIDKNTIYTYSVWDSSLIASKSVDKTELNFIATRYLYKASTGNTLQPLEGTGYMYIAGKDGCIAVDKQLNITESVDKDEVYFAEGDYKGYTILSHGEQIVICDRRRKIVATLPGGQKLRFTGKVLTYKYMDTILETDLSNVLTD